MKQPLVVAFSLALLVTGSRALSQPEMIAQDRSHVSAVAEKVWSNDTTRQRLTELLATGRKEDALELLRANGLLVKPRTAIVYDQAAFQALQHGGTFAPTTARGCKNPKLVFKYTYYADGWTLEISVVC